MPDLSLLHDQRLAALVILHKIDFQLPAVLLRFPLEGFGFSDVACPFTIIQHPDFGR